MASKPKVAVFVLCSTERTGWVNPYLVSSLMRLSRDSRLDIQVGMVIDRSPVEHARNLCVVDSRGRRADMCIQIDNDMTLPSNFADIVLEAHETGKAVVTLAYGTLPADGPKMIPEDQGPSDGNFRQTERGGGGVLIISSEVWRAIPIGPWFRWLVNDDETLSRHVSEDYYFCWLMQTNGLKVWTHQAVAGHLKTDDATKWCLRVEAKTQ
jgi:hypothetical protein